MDLRIFANAPLVPIVGTIEEVGDSTLTFLAKKPRSQRRTRMVIPIRDAGWWIHGGSKLENHPDVLYVRPTAFRQEPATYYKDVDVDSSDGHRSFTSGNRTVVIGNEDLVRVSVQEDVSTEAEKRKQPKAARVAGKKRKAAAAVGSARKARKRKAAADDDFED